MDSPQQPVPPWMPIFIPLPSPPGWRPPLTAGSIVGRLAGSLIIGILSLFLVVFLPSIEDLYGWIRMSVTILLLCGITICSVMLDRWLVHKRTAVYWTALGCVVGLACWCGLIAASAGGLVSLSGVGTLCVAVFTCTLVSGFALGGVGRNPDDIWALALGCGLSTEVGVALAILAGFETSTLSMTGVSPYGIFFGVIFASCGCFFTLLGAPLGMAGGLLGGFLRTQVERRVNSPVPLAPPMFPWWPYPPADFNTIMPPQA